MLPSIAPKRSLLALPLVCLSIVSFSQSVSIDSLKNELEIYKKEDTVRVNILTNLSDQYKHLDFHQSLDFAEQALRIADQLYYNRGIALANYRKAFCYWALGDSKLSIEKALLASELSEQHGFLDIQAESFRILAVNYRGLNELNKASEYIKKAEVLSLQTKNWDLLSRIYNNAGIIEFDKGHNDTALLIYNKGLEVAREHATSKFHLCQIVSNIGEVYLESNPDLAISYFNKALKMARETSNNKQAEAGINSDLGRAYTLKKDYEKAEQFLQEGLRLTHQLGLRRVTGHTYLALVDLKVREGKPKEALGYMRDYNAVRDSLNSSAMTRQIVELENRYETQRKEQAIKLLEQEKRIQIVWRNALIIGFILSIAAIIIIYRLQKLRNQKARQLLNVHKELNEKLKETDVLKSRFFANISHEFRTPLSLILGPVEDKINSTAILPADKEDLKLVKRNANRLLDLVNQLLDLSKLEAGKMELNSKSGNLDEFLKVLVASFDSLAENKLIHFSKSITIPAQGLCYDQDKLEKIITNILFNAFKFTPPHGTVNLSIVTSPTDNELKIIISDTGKGIPAEEQPHVFSPFYQSKNIMDDGQVGTGLGLSLVSELVKLHNGKITLASQVNHGTTISINLPLGKVQFDEFLMADTTTSIISPVEYLHGEDRLTVEESEPYSQSILIVEDNPDLRRFIASCFTGKFKVLTANNGEEGLDVAFNRIPDIIVSDVMMPKMDGIAMTDKLREDIRTSHIPVILLTAKVDLDSRMKGLKTGANEYLSKPFLPEELKVRVSNLMTQQKRLAAKFLEGVVESKPKAKELSMDERFIKKAQELIAASLSDPNFGVEQLAEEMNLSRTQLFRKFKALLDTSPSEFINDIRLQKAAELIRAKTDALAQISYAVGYNEQSYFAKRFRKKFGMSPSEYSETNQTA